MKVNSLRMTAAAFATMVALAFAIVGIHQSGPWAPSLRQPAWLRDAPLVGISPDGKTVRIIAFASTTRFALGDVSFEESSEDIERAAAYRLKKRAEIAVAIPSIGSKNGAADGDGWRVPMIAGAALASARQ